MRTLPTFWDADHTPLGAVPAANPSKFSQPNAVSQTLAALTSADSALVSLAGESSDEQPNDNPPYVAANAALTGRAHSHQPTRPGVRRQFIANPTVQPRGRAAGALFCFPAPAPPFWRQIR